VAAPPVPAEVDNGGNLGGVSRLLGRTVLDQFYADQQPLAAHVADDLMAHRAAQPVAGKPPERELDGGNTAMNFRIRSLGL
jgi:hypothetical protein